MIHFGTGGWRAVIGDGFTKANVQLLTLALARKMLDEGRADKGFVIGYDRRFLSEEAAGWAAEVMAGQGILCRIIHRENAVFPSCFYRHIRDREAVIHRQIPNTFSCEFH